MFKNKPSSELDAKVIASYDTRKTTHQVAKEIGCSQTFVIDTLKRHNIARRTIYSYTTKYLPNEKFFEVIDTEEKAYILGILYADGNNYVNIKNAKYQVSLALQLRDKLIMNKIRDLISPTSKLTLIQSKNINRQDQFRLRIRSKLISEQLIKLGCVPNKALILEFPEWLIDPELQRHFIRGYFDGDGSLYAKKPKASGQVDWGWQLTSSKNFTIKTKQIIEQQTGVHFTLKLAHPKSDNAITTTISTGGNLQVKKVLDWMYRDATIYMDRKYDKYQEFLKYIQYRN
jgi:intein/homing endonuclease